MSISIIDFLLFKREKSYNKIYYNKKVVIGQLNKNKNY